MSKASTSSEKVNYQQGFTPIYHSEWISSLNQSDITENHDLINERGISHPQHNFASLLFVYSPVI